ncbi:HNH endonuclease [Modestobacter italicus]|uniref:HNH endonuclease n=1 Tax=Modestobacter italicus (strain DSM 44449 / CECT 9708 / BC 501) TaxID=2732864 RepID=I4ETP3_MODI5|nr:HNH endonuclease signature motif containing protein [Modestobacter marinus]CCH86756.1 HNH endonuclease [Modestobacter marinus]
MGELQSALDALAAEDLFSLPPGAVLARTAALLQLANRVAAELTRTVRHADATGAAEHDGKKTAQSWLRGHGHLTPGEAGRMVRSGRALEHLPATAAAFAEGTVTASQVAAIAPIADDAARAAADAQGVDLGVIDQALVVVAHSESHARLQQVVHHYREALDPDGAEPDPTEGRRFTVTRHADGSGTGRFDLDAVGIEKVLAGIESIVQASRPKGDDRTRAQQQADALVQLVDNQLAAGNLPTLRTQKPHVVLGLDMDDFVDPATGPGAARTGFGSQISAARARWLACDGSISRIVMTPDGELLDLGRDHRVVTPGLRKAVEQRDRHCVFAGCDAPTHWCDVHHLIHWINGGETSLDNSGLLCERHHTKVHHGFRIERDPGGRWHTWRPDGTEILIGPPLLI